MCIRGCNISTSVLVAIPEWQGVLFEAFSHVTCAQSTHPYESEISTCYQYRCGYVTNNIYTLATINNVYLYSNH